MCKFTLSDEYVDIIVNRVIERLGQLLYEKKLPTANCIQNNASVDSNNENLVKISEYFMDTPLDRWHNFLISKQDNESDMDVCCDIIPLFKDDIDIIRYMWPEIDATTSVSFVIKYHKSYISRGKIYLLFKTKFSELNNTDIAIHGLFESNDRLSSYDVVSINSKAICDGKISQDAIEFLLYLIITDKIKSISHKDLNKILQYYDTIYNIYYALRDKDIQPKTVLDGVNFIRKMKERDY